MDLLLAFVQCDCSERSLWSTTGKDSSSLKYLMDKDIRGIRVTCRTFHKSSNVRAEFARRGLKTTWRRSRDSPGGAALKRARLELAGLR